VGNIDVGGGVVWWCVEEWVECNIVEGRLLADCRKKNKDELLISRFAALKLPPKQQVVGHNSNALRHSKR
jgi:hypothetical protein